MEGRTCGCKIFIGKANECIPFRSKEIDGKVLFKYILLKYVVKM
jgi:hypothetical protein